MIHSQAHPAQTSRALINPRSALNTGDKKGMMRKEIYWGIWKNHLKHKRKTQGMHQISHGSSDLHLGSLLIFCASEQMVGINDWVVLSTTGCVNSSNQWAAANNSRQYYSRALTLSSAYTEESPRKLKKEGKKDQGHTLRVWFDEYFFF